MKAQTVDSLPEAARGRSAAPNPLEGLGGEMVADLKPRRLMLTAEDDAKVIVRQLRRAVNGKGMSLLIRRLEGEADNLYVQAAAKITRTRKAKPAA